VIVCSDHIVVDRLCVKRKLDVLSIKVHNNRYHHITVLIIVTRNVGLKYPGKSRSFFGLLRI